MAEMLTQSPHPEENSGEGGPSSVNVPDMQAIIESIPEDKLALIVFSSLLNDINTGGLRGDSDELIETGFFEGWSRKQVDDYAKSLEGTIKSLQN